MDSVPLIDSRNRRSPDRMKRNTKNKVCFCLKFFVIFSAIFLIFLFRTQLFVTEETGTDSSAYGSQLLSSVIYSPAECDEISGENLTANEVFAGDADFLRGLEFKHHDEKCSCSDINAKKLFEKSHLLNDEMKLKRKKLYENYERQNWAEMIVPERTQCLANSMLTYPTSPTNVEPGESVKLEDIFLDTEFTGKMHLQISAKYGKILLNSDRKFSSNNFLNISSVQEANEILSSIEYSATLYDARPYLDHVTIRVIFESIQDHNDQDRSSSNYKKEALAQVPVKVTKIVIPALPVYHGDGVEDKVTIVVKTYMRYKCVRHLIYSIRKFYPRIRIIIADDSEVNYRQTLDSDDDRIFQFFMPANYGWFAGRNLLVSQVQTDYFVWCDDDFVFHDQTDLALLLDKIDRSGYDVVGGGVNTNESCTSGFAGKMKSKTFYDSNEGICWTRESGHHGQWEDCYVGDVLLNFFIARTETAGTVRFNPNYDTFAHVGWFMAAQTKLRIMLCSKAWVGHRKDLCIDKNVIKYQTERSGTNEKFAKNYYRTYFSQYMQCN